MKKLLFILIVLMAMPFVFADVSVKHFVEDTQEGESIFVHVVVRADSDTLAFDLGEFLPETWEVKDWWIQAYNKEDVLFESEIGEFMNQDYNINHWTFDKLKKDIALSFEISPKDAGEHEFVSLWFHPDGFDMETIEFTVTEKENEGNSITGFAVSNVEKETRISSGVTTTVTIKSSISDVLANVNSIDLY